MQTVAVQIRDGYMKKFISYVNSHSENITITKDKNLELDPYFYESHNIQTLLSIYLQVILIERLNL